MLKLSSVNILIISLSAALVFSSCTDPSALGNRNQRPVADAGSNITLSAGIQYQLNGGRSVDPEEETLGYLWKLLEKPEGSHAELSNPYVESPVIYFDVPGTYVIRLLVNDGVQDGIPDQIVITVIQDASTIPAFDPAPGTYYTSQKVAIRFDLSEYIIHYTLDGTKPDANSPVFVPGSDSIEINTSTELKAIAINSEGEMTPINTGLYRILPVFEIVTTSFEFPDGAGYGKSSIAIKNLTGETRSWELTSDDSNLSLYPAAGELESGKTEYIQIQVLTRNLDEGAYNTVADLYERSDDRRILIKQINISTDIQDNDAPEGTPFISVTPMSRGINFHWDTSNTDIEGLMIVRGDSVSSDFPVNGYVYSSENATREGSVFYAGNDGDIIDSTNSNNYSMGYTIYAYDENYNYGNPSPLILEKTSKDRYFPVKFTIISESEGSLFVQWDSAELSGSETISVIRSSRMIDISKNDIRSGDFGADGKLVYSGNGSSFSDSIGEANGSAIYYYAFAVNGSDNSPVSLAVFTPEDNISPLSPDMPTINSSRVLSGDEWFLENNLGWVNPSDNDFAGTIVFQSENEISPDFTAVDGKVYTSGETLDGITIVYQGPRSRFTDQNLKSQTKYYYALCAYDFSRNYSKPIFVQGKTRDLTAPETLSDIVYNYSDSGSVLFKWNNPVDDDFSGTLILKSSFSFKDFRMNPGDEIAVDNVLYTDEGKKAEVVFQSGKQEYLYSNIDWGDQYFLFLTYDNSLNYSRGVEIPLDIPEPAGIDLDVFSSYVLQSGDNITLDYSVLDNEGQVCQLFNDFLSFDVMFNNSIVGALGNSVSENLENGTGSLTTDIYLYPLKLASLPDKPDSIDIAVKASGKNSDGDIVFEGISDSFSIEIHDLPGAKVARNENTLDFSWPDPVTSGFDSIVLFRSEKGFVKGSDFKVPRNSIAGDILERDLQIIYYGTDTEWMDILEDEGNLYYYQLFGLNGETPFPVMNYSASFPPAPEAVTLERGNTGEAYLNWEVPSDTIFDPESEGWINNIAGTLIIKGVDEAAYTLKDGALPKVGDFLGNTARVVAIVEGFDIGNSWGFWTDKSPDIFNGDYNLINYDHYYNYSEYVYISSALLQDVLRFRFDNIGNNEIELSWEKPVDHQDFRVLIIRWPGGKEGEEKPIQGKYYRVGDIIGKGEVIYNGQDLHYLDSILTGSSYVYRAFYVDEKNRYGSGSAFLYK